MDNRNHGNAVHDGHALLGEIALRRGDVETAERHLGQAGESPGSPQLGSYGPNMTLARELLARGQKDAVRGYLEGCRKFWRAGSSAIDLMLRFIETSTLAAIEADEEEARRRAEETREVFHLGGRGFGFGRGEADELHARGAVVRGDVARGVGAANARARAAARV